MIIASRALLRAGCNDLVSNHDSALTPTLHSASFLFTKKVEYGRRLHADKSAIKVWYAERDGQLRKFSSNFCTKVAMVIIGNVSTARMIDVL